MLAVDMSLFLKNAKGDVENAFEPKDTKKASPIDPKTMPKASKDFRKQPQDKREGKDKT